MPPAESGSESEGGEDIPFRAKSADKKLSDELQQNAETDDEAGDDEEEEYVVERILDHRVNKKGAITLQVKWQGWGLDDATWEPEDNLADLDDLKKYYRHLGGRPTKDSAKKIGNGPATKRKTSDTPTKSEPPTSHNNKKQRVSNTYMLDDEDGSSPFAAPVGLWEDHILGVDTIVENDDGIKQCILIWKNNKRSRHRLPVVHQKCPQHMLTFYEMNLQFKPTGNVHFDEPKSVMKSIPPASGAAKAGNDEVEDGDEDTEMSEIKGVATAA